MTRPAALPVRATTRISGGKVLRPEQKKDAPKAIKLTPKQSFVFSDSNARLNLFDGAIRSGKTIATNARWVKYLLRIDSNDWKGEGLPIVCGVSAGSIERNIIAPMIEFYGEKNIRHVKSRQRLFVFGVECVVLGADNEASFKVLRGLTGGGALVDELSLLNERFFIELLGRQSARGAKIFATTNPDGPKHWLKTKYIDRRNEIGLKYYRFELRDNPTLDPEYIADIEKKYSGVWKARLLRGLWVAAEGLVYPEFEEKPPFFLPAPPEKAALYFVGVDYGTQNPAAFILFGEAKRAEFSPGKPRFWAERELYHAGRETGIQKTDSELADLFEEFLAEVPGTRSRLDAIYIDPSAASFIAELKGRGFLVKPANNSVLDGIRRQASAIHTGEYAVCAACKQTAADYGAYRWDTKAVERGEDKPIKEDDHTKDAERYAILSRYGLGERLNYRLLNKR